VTLNVDGLGAKPLRSVPSVELPAGVLVQGMPYVAVYNSSDAAFYLQNAAGYANPYSIPLGAGLDYWGSTTPNSIFAFPAGQAISRTTYATLFTLLGTTYGTGDGSTTFNLPDKTGRVSAMKEALATRLTTAGGGIDGGTLGAVGGSQNVTLATSQIPSLTSVNATQAISVASTTNQVVSASGLSDNFTSIAGSNIFNGQTRGPVTSTGSNSISVTYTNSSQAPTKTVTPAIICNYIIRII
jgi:microcystin-dependent protein